MKTKTKNIFKLLGLSLFIGNFSIYSSIATNNIEVPNRYQTLEGEYITIDNSTEGELHEIEIFGNTIQDENNLEDIQSVGDLYVDESGNPILDSQGRKQYKIDIITSDLPFTQIGYELIEDLNPFGSEGTTSFNTGYKSSNTFDVYREDNIPNLQVRLFNVDDDGNKTSGDQYHVKQGYQKWTSNGDNIAIGFYCPEPWIMNGYHKERVLELLENDLKISIIENSNNSSLIKYPLRMSQENKKTILLPTQLHKVGDVADRLYWDDEKGKYIIEKNIDVQTPSVESYAFFLGLGFENNEVFAFKVPSQIKYSKTDTSDNEKGLIVSSLKVCDYFKYNDIGYDSYISKVSDYFIAIFNKGTFINEPTFVEWLAESNLTFYYSEGFTPQLIETNITSKIKIPTYKGKTHIYIETENGINPTLKVTVDRIYQLTKNAVEEAKVNPTTENISLARVYINMLDESEYKEELHEQLNQVFASDVTFDKKTITANLDVYIKSENMLSMNLSTNSITFDDYSGVNEIEQENAVEISINSSLPYQLNAYLLDEMYNSDKTKKIDMDRLQIKDNTEDSYSEFTDINEKLVLNDTCDSGNDKSHSISLKLKGGNAYESDIYRTIIKFEVVQK